MIRTKLSLLATGALVAIFAVAGVAPAAAQEAPDQPSTDEVNSRGVCSSGWHWIPLGVVSTGFLPVGGTQANFNGTESPATVTFSSSASATMSATVDGSFEVGVDSKIVSANGTLGTSLQASMTAHVGTEIQITVPPGEWGYGEFGISSNDVRGEEQYWQGIGTVCNITQRIPANVRAPFHAGWKTWTD